MTNHDIVSEHKDVWNAEVVDGSDNWQIIRCKGCESVTFRHISFFSEDVNPDGTGGTTVRLYPPRGTGILTKKDFSFLAENVSRLYQEVIDSYNVRAFTLCAAGIRAIIEGICKNHGISQGQVTSIQGTVRLSKNLDGKISGLAANGLITERFAHNLHHLRFLGNEAIHELAKPSLNELTLAIQIIEHTIESLYEIQQTANDFIQASAKRKAKP